MSTPENDDLHLDLRFTDRPRTWIRPAAIVSAAALVLLIVATMTTNIAAHILPMSDDYMQVLIPQAPDGKEPLSLKTLDHTITDNTLTVTGSIANRTDYPISGLLAVMEAQDMNGQISATVEVPIDPAQIPPQGTGNFQTTITLKDKPSGYSLKFRLPDGPFIPHRDDRALTYGLSDK